MKPIILTEEAKTNALEVFKNLLNGLSSGSDLKINITTETLLQGQGIEKPIVYVASTAFVKMQTLINSSDKELAWYGTVTKVLNNYLIEDIYVYPQTVTTATVDADEEKCAKWFMELPDEVINKLRFQGHSHVNMTASPSGRDTDNWLKFANLLRENEFYLLCIGNKKGEYYWNIYDKSINVYFENKDITMIVVDDLGNSIAEWAKDSIKKYIETPPTRTVSFSQGSYYTMNGHQYETIPERKTTSHRETKAVKEALAIVPSRYKSIIEYEVETDMYFCDTSSVPGFHYSGMWGCYIMSGASFREQYGTVKPSNKTKKDNKTK